MCLAPLILLNALREKIVGITTLSLYFIVNFGLELYFYSLFKHVIYSRVNTDL